jgi:nitrogen regulatory protein P-II 1
MKLVTAIIQPEKLDGVRDALLEAKVSRITVTRVAGHGQQEDIDLYRGKEINPNLIPKVEIKIACNEDFVDSVVAALIKGAKHGEGRIGDGKIFVTALEQCIRIRTEESGPAAI